MTFMKWISIAGLALAGFWRSSESYQVILGFVVCTSAVMIVMEAVKGRKYVWASLFGAIALIFNPIEPFTFSPRYILWIDLASVAMFLVSLAAVKRKPILSVQSITNRLPRTQAL